MSEVREILIDTMRDLRDGKCPQKVAELTGKNGVAVAMNHAQENREYENLGKAEIAKSVASAQEKIQDF